MLVAIFKNSNKLLNRKEFTFLNMVSNESIVKIIEPSKEIFELIAFYKKLIQKALPNCKITLIGSFAIPMCGKEEFDLLIEVDDVKNSQRLIKENSQNRIGIGPIVDGEGFCRSKKRISQSEADYCRRGAAPKRFKI